MNYSKPYVEATMTLAQEYVAIEKRQGWSIRIAAQHLLVTHNTIVAWRNQAKLDGGAATAGPSHWQPPAMAVKLAKLLALMGV